MKESASFRKYRAQLRDVPTLQVNDVRHVSSPYVLFPRGQVSLDECAFASVLSAGNDPGAAVSS